MKRIIVGCILAISIATITTVDLNATSNNRIKNEVPVTAAQAERAKVITARLYEIKAMDKSSMSTSEKKALRKEVKAMKKEMNSGNGGIYISVGAVIIIILLLILIL
jgi:glutamate synthase domain-containing protein 2